MELDQALKEIEQKYEQWAELKVRTYHSIRGQKSKQAYAEYAVKMNEIIRGMNETYQQYYKLALQKFTDDYIAKHELRLLELMQEIKPRTSIDGYFGMEQEQREQ